MSCKNGKNELTGKIMKIRKEDIDYNFSQDLELA